MLSTQSTQGPSNCIIPLFRDHPAQVILVALGIIVCLGATFLMLASYQILPHTINSISHLCVWGQVMGYGTLGFGLILIAAGSVCYLVIKRNTDSGDAPLSNAPFLDYALFEKATLNVEQMIQQANALPQRSEEEILDKQLLEMSPQELAEFTIQTFSGYFTGYGWQPRVKERGMILKLLAHDQFMKERTLASLACFSNMDEIAFKEIFSQLPQQRFKELFLLVNSGYEEQPRARARESLFGQFSNLLLTTTTAVFFQLTEYQYLTYARNVVRPWGQQNPNFRPDSKQRAIIALIKQHSCYELSEVRAHTQIPERFLK